MPQRRWRRRGAPGAVVPPRRPPLLRRGWKPRAGRRSALSGSRHSASRSRVSLRSAAARVAASSSSPPRLSPAGAGLAMQIFVKTLTGKTITLEVSRRRRGLLIALPRRARGGFRFALRRRDPPPGPGAAEVGQASPHLGPVRRRRRRGRARPPRASRAAPCAAARPPSGRPVPSGPRKCRDTRRKPARPLPGALAHPACRACPELAAPCGAEPAERSGRDSEAPHGSSACLV